MHPCASVQVQYLTLKSPFISHTLVPAISAVGFCKLDCSTTKRVPNPNDVYICRYNIYIRVRKALSEICSNADFYSAVCGDIEHVKSSYTVHKCTHCGIPGPIPSRLYRPIITTILQGHSVPSAGKETLTILMQSVLTLSTVCYLHSQHLNLNKRYL